MAYPNQSFVTFLRTTEHNTRGGSSGAFDLLRSKAAATLLQSPTYYNIMWLMLLPVLWKEHTVIGEEGHAQILTGGFNSAGVIVLYYSRRHNAQQQEEEALLFTNTLQLLVLCSDRR